jgi:hypothetical protein
MYLNVARGPPIPAAPAGDPARETNWFSTDNEKR